MFILSISCFLVSVSDNLVDLMSDSEVEISYTSIIGKSHNSHILPHNSNHLGPERIPLIYDYDSERVSRSLLEKVTSLSTSLYAIISNVGEGINRVEIPMPPRVLSDEEIQGHQHMK